MKLSALLNEVNQEQELLQLCDNLVEDLTAAHLEQFPTLTDYSYSYKVSRKYIKIITDSGNQKSVWGFINKSEWTNKKDTTFLCGDVLMSAGWATPALNSARGNLFMDGGYKITGMRKYGPDYLK